jgi:hypothetical protein
MKKFLRISGFIALALLTLVALGYAVENWRGSRAWSAEQARIRESGEPLVWPDLLPPAPSPERNFAAIPLYQGLFDYEVVRDAKGRTRHQWKGGPVSTRIMETFRLPNPPKSPAKAEASRTPALDLEETLALFEGSTNYPPITPSGKPAQDILRLLESRKEAFDQLREAAARPECRFGIRYEDNVEALLPHLATLKAAASLLRIRAIARLETGERTAAADDILLILRLGEAAGSDPILISMLVRIAIQSIATSAVWQGWQLDQWKPEDYQRFQTAFAAFNPREAMVDSLRAERIFSTSLVDLLKQDPSRYLQATGLTDSQSSPTLPLRLFPGGWLRFNQVTISRCLDGIAQQVRTHPATAALSTIPDPAKTKDFGSFPHSFMARMLVPAVSKSVGKVDRTQVNILLVTTACAIERFRADNNGKLPPTLASLVPAYLATVPIDPMSGKPLVYKAGEAGDFELYSFGLDGQDDGGAGAIGSKTDQLDWAWPSRQPTEDSHRF